MLRFYAYPDPTFRLYAYPDPTFHFYAYPDPNFHFLRTGNPDPIFHFYAYPDPTFHFYAYPDPIFHCWCESGSDISLSMRIRIRPFASMRTRVWLFINVTWICDHWPEDTPRLHCESLRLTASICALMQNLDLAYQSQCCGSGSGIRCLFLTPGSGIRNRFIPYPGSRNPDPKLILLRA